MNHRTGKIFSTIGFILAAIGFFTAAIGSKNSGELVFLVGIYVAIVGFMLSIYGSRDANPSGWKSQLIMVVGFAVASVSFIFARFYPSLGFADFFFFSGALIMMFGMLGSMKKRMSS
jgi:hypothetical protein